MSKSKYPLIEQLGLNTLEGHRDYPEAPGYNQYVRAEHLERVLEQAVKVSGLTHDEGMEIMAFSKCEAINDTHTALLINVQPIVRDTAESILRDLVEDYKDDLKYSVDKTRNDLYRRAIALLEGK